MDTTTYQLFVYGSLRSGFHNPAYAYLTKYFHLLGEAVVKGKFYDNVTHPVAVPCNEDSFITGELYVVNNPDEFKWVVDQLDDYEGLNVEAGETPLYRRETVQVFQEGMSSASWIYWYNGSVAQMKEITTGDVLNYLQQQNKP
ncbi:MAG: gamma-glutamylcyclotransferase family protein [Ferruginibacter sp.]